LDGLKIAKLVRERQTDAVTFLLTAFQPDELPVGAGVIDSYFDKPLDLQQLHLAMKGISQLRRRKKK
jgi:hypothetical protein